ncbi:MAG: hypothetical protein K8H88_28595, partial [Sandaracinaceae bacterium]|nr:hypothetical protein [Sandaracinaceae bacterium]
LVGVATLAGVTLAALAASAALLVAPLALATAAVVGIVAAGIELYNWFRNTDFESLGRSLVDGLIAGMRSRLAALSTEVRGLASRAQGALTEALGIRSPSRVFAQLGVQIPRGLAQGVQAGAPIALGAIDELAAVPDVHRSPAGSSSRSVVIEQLHIHAQSSDPEALAASFRDAVANVLEGLAIEEGAPA